MNFLYFDPSIGAMIVQVIVAAISGVLLFSKNLVYKVKVFFGVNIDQEDDINIEDSDIEKKEN